MSMDARERETHYAGHCYSEVFRVSEYRPSFRFKKLKIAESIWRQVNLINFYKPRPPYWIRHFERNILQVLKN